MEGLEVKLYFILNNDTLGLVADLLTLDEVEVQDMECAVHHRKKDVCEKLCASLNSYEGANYKVVEYEIKEV
jgi:hypothetical protein